MTITLTLAGCCHPEPGTAAYAVVVAGLVASPYRLPGIVPARDSTAGVGEWWALRDGLEQVIYAHDRGRDVDLSTDGLMIRTDCEAVVNALADGVLAIVPPAHAAIVAECRTLLGRITAAGCRWRTELLAAGHNAQAHALAREAWVGVAGKPFPGTTPATAGANNGR